MSSPRIISGKARGTRLKSVPGDSTRPITDRVKEALFNIIGPDIEDASILDLFGGTGSVGIEALSRGAKTVRFIDINRRAVETIKQNLIHTRMHEQAEVIKTDALKMLQHPPDQTFEYVYVAPPQYKDIWWKTLVELDSNPGWLAHDAWIIVQIHPVEFKPVKYTNFKEFDQRRYGSTQLIFYETA